MPYGIEAKDLIIFVAGAVIALLIAYFFYKRGLPQKRLSYSTRVRSLVYRSSNQPAGLKDGLRITFDGKEIRSFKRVTVLVWNSGNQPITGQELTTKMPLHVTVPPKGFDVLQGFIQRQSRAANNVTLNGLEIRFDYLNARDGFVIDIFGDHIDDKVTLQPGIELKGDVVGATEPPKYVTLEFASSRIPIILAFVAAVIFAGVGMLGVLDINPRLLSPEQEDKLRIVTGFIFLGGSPIALLGALFLAMKTERMPQTLVSDE